MALALHDPGDTGSQPVLTDAQPATDAFKRFRAIMPASTHPQIAECAAFLHEEGNATVGILRQTFSRSTYQQMFDLMLSAGGRGRWAIALASILDVKFTENVPLSAALIPSTSTSSSSSEQGDASRKRKRDEAEASEDGEMRPPATRKPSLLAAILGSGGTDRMMPSDHQLNMLLKRTPGTAPFKKPTRVRAGDASDIMNWYYVSSKEKHGTTGQCNALFTAIDTFLVGKGVLSNNHLSWEEKAESIWRSSNRPDKFQEENRPRKQKLLLDEGSRGCMLGQVEQARAAPDVLPLELASAPPAVASASAPPAVASASAPPAVASASAPPVDPPVLADDHSMHFVADEVGWMMSDTEEEGREVVPDRILPLSSPPPSHSLVPPAEETNILADVTAKHAADPAMQRQEKADAKAAELTALAARATAAFERQEDEEEPQPRFAFAQSAPAPQAPAPPPPAKVAREARAAEKRQAVQDAAAAKAAAERAEKQEKADLRTITSVMNGLITAVEKQAAADVRKAAAEKKRADKRAAAQEKRGSGKGGAAARAAAPPP
jgi:hypothetical protein